MEELNAALHKFNQMVVGPSRQICRNTIAFCMTQVMLPLLEKIGEIDPRFKCTCPMPNESYFPGMKTSCVNEFELTVILTNLLDNKSFEDIGVQDSSLACHGHVVTKQASHPLDDVLLTTSGSSQNLLSAEKIRQVFAQLVNQASSILPVMGITLEVIYKDPCTVIKIFRGPDVYLFELVPAFIFQQEWPVSSMYWCEEPNEWITENDIKILKDFGFYALALPSSTHPNDPSLFRISFNMAEKYLLRGVIQDNSLPSSVSHVFRKDCERILRMIRESDKDDFSPVCSYHIKTALLHECRRWPDPRAWTQDKLAERFLDVLRALIVALDKKDLQHFFVKDCNLLQFYAPEKLTGAAGRLKAIYQDIYSSPSNSIRLQC